MARYRRANTRRRSTRSRGSSYRAGPTRRSYRARTTSRRRTASRGQRTIRIEVVAAPASAVARPEIGMKAAGAPRKAAF